jgi:hypothetical protein
MQANMAITPAGKRAMQACSNHSQSGVKCRASWHHIVRGGVNRHVSLQQLFPRYCHHLCNAASTIPRRDKMRCKHASDLTWPGNPPCQPAAAIPPVPSWAMQACPVGYGLSHGAGLVGNCLSNGACISHYAAFCADMLTRHREIDCLGVLTFA